MPEDAAFCPACGFHMGKGAARTAQEIYDISIRLMDAQNESTGSTDTADTREYRLRTPSLLNSLLDRAYPASDTYRQAEASGMRPICPKVTEMTDPVQLDERLCTGVLPYGLAGLLLSEENPALADFFWQTFLEQLAVAKTGLAAMLEDVENVYGGWSAHSGGIEHGQFSRW